MPGEIINHFILFSITMEKATERDCYNEIPRLCLPSTGALSSLVP